METDWLKFWRELVTMTAVSSHSGCVSRYEAHLCERNERPDELLSFVLENITNENTVLDIGAGSGRWAIPMASIARNVTAVEPSAAMRDILRKNADAAQIDNI